MPRKSIVSIANQIYQVFLRESNNRDITDLVNNFLGKWFEGHQKIIVKSDSDCSLFIFHFHQTDVWFDKIELFINDSISIAHVPFWGTVAASILANQMPYHSRRCRSWRRRSLTKQNVSAMISDQTTHHKEIQIVETARSWRTERITSLAF